MMAKDLTQKTFTTSEKSAVSVAANSALNEMEKVVNSTSQEFEKTVEPIRKNILKRFPTLFLLVVTFGFTAVVTGMEQLLVQYEILQNHPTYIFWLGIAVLVVTGRVYKRLS